MRIIKRVAGHYVVQETPFGRNYKWAPEQVVLECSKCAKRTTLKRSQINNSEGISCECGKCNTADIWEELVIEVLDEEQYEVHNYPWRHDAKAQDKQHTRDEVGHSKDSAWRYNDVTTRNGIEE